MSASSLPATGMRSSLIDSEPPEVLREVEDAAAPERMPPVALGELLSVGELGASGLLAACEAPEAVPEVMSPVEVWLSLDSLVSDSSCVD